MDDNDTNDNMMQLKLAVLQLGFRPSKRNWIVYGYKTDYSCLGLDNLAQNGFKLEHPDYPTYTAVPL